MFSVRYQTTDLSRLMSDLNKYSLGHSTLFERLDALSGTYSNYPPVNIIEQSETSLRVELALAGFNRPELKVYTESGRLVVEGKRENKSTEKFIERSVAYRNFRWERILPEQWKVDSVAFENGLLTIVLNRYVPEHEKRKDYLI